LQLIRTDDKKKTFCWRFSFYVVLVHAMNNRRFEVNVEYGIDVHGMEDHCDQKEAQQVELDHIDSAPPELTTQCG